MVAAKFAAGYRGMTLGEEDSVLSLQVSSVTVDGRPSRLAGIPGKGRKMFEKDVGLGAFESVVGHMVRGGAGNSESPHFSLTARQRQCMHPDVGSSTGAHMRTEVPRGP